MDNSLESLARSIHKTAVEKGWWTTELGTQRNFGEALALIHSEVSEALESWREGDDIRSISYEYADGEISSQATRFSDKDQEYGKPVGVASELADVVIRVMDLCEGMGIPLVQAIFDKNNYNKTRPHRHGGKLA
jgi:NTP pyrophosphatase (non-canonical NTP hydrolase)